MLYLFGGVCGRHADDLWQVNAHRQKLRHDVEDIMGSADMNIGTDAVREEALCDGGDGLFEGKADLAIAHVEDDWFLLGLFYEWFYLLRDGVDHRFPVP